VGIATLNESRDAPFADATDTIPADITTNVATTMPLGLIA